MPTKNKTEIEPGGVEQVTFSCHSDDPLPDPPITYPDYPKSLQYSDYVVLEEKFWDESWNGGRKTWKNCEHYKLISTKPRSTPHTFVDAASFGQFHYDAGCSKQTARWQLNTAGAYSVPFGAAGKPIDGLTAFDQPNLLDGTFVPPPSNLDDLNSRALKTMLPKIKEELSIPNFILELKDFKQLPGLIRRLREIVPFLGRFFRNKKTIPSFRDLLKLPSDVYLTYQFALAPLVRDIMGLYASLADHQAQIQNLLSREGRTQTRHFSFKWLEFPALTTELSATSGWDQPISVIGDPAYVWRQEREVRTDASEFHAEIQYNYNYTEFQREFARVIGLMDKLGLNNAPQRIWNALPFSFVLDWVVDVNRFLGSYGTGQGLEPTINIQQYLWSIKRKRKIKVDMIVDIASTFVPEHYAKGSRVSFPVVTETAYRRQVGLPGISLITTSGLSLKELSLGAALITSQRRYRGPRRLPTPR